MNEVWYNDYRFSDEAQLSLTCKENVSKIFGLPQDTATLVNIHLTITSGGKGTSIPLQGEISSIINEIQYKQRVVLVPTGVSRSKYCQIPPYRVFPLGDQTDESLLNGNDSIFITSMCLPNTKQSWIFDHENFSPKDHLLIEAYIYHLFSELEGVSLSARLGQLTIETNNEVILSKNALQSGIVLLNEDVTSVSKRCNSHFWGNRFEWTKDLSTNYSSSILVTLANMLIGNTDYYYVKSDEANFDGFKGHNIFFHQVKNQIYLITYDFDLNPWSVPHYKKNNISDVNSASVVFTDFLKTRINTCKRLIELNYFTDHILNKVQDLKYYDISLKRKNLINAWLKRLISDAHEHAKYINNHLNCEKE